MRNFWKLALPAIASVAAIAAHAAAPVRVGAVYGLSGPYAAAGGDLQKGATLAADEINAAGGIKSLGGAKLELVFGDTQSKPIVGVGEAERLITQEKVVALIGSTTSTETIPMVQVAEKFGVPQIVPMAQHESITARGFKWVWSSTLIDADYATGLMQGLDMLLKMEPAKNRVGVLFPNNDYGLQMEKLLRPLLEKRKDINLVAMIQYNSQTQDLLQPSLKLKAATPDIVLQVGYFRDGVLASKAYQQLDFHPVVLGTGGMSGDPKLATELGPLVDGQFAVTPFAGDAPNVKPVAEAYAKRYNIKFTLNAALGYQGVVVVAEALEKAGNTSPAAIASALRSIKLTGDKVITASDYIQFDGNGRNLGRATAITQFQNGQPVTVWPPAHAVAKPVWAQFNAKRP